MAVVDLKVTSRSLVKGMSYGILRRALRRHYPAYAWWHAAICI